MTAKDLAALLNGREYGSEITKAEETAAKESGLVVVLGQSDDIMEFRGAVDGEVDCYNGGIAYVDKNGIYEAPDNCDECNECSFVTERRNACATISAIWCKNEYPWSYHTGIPHETFEIMEDGEKYCRGIVFSLGDLRRPEKYSANEKSRLFNILRGVAVGSYLPHKEKTELIDFIAYLEREPINE